MKKNLLTVGFLAFTLSASAQVLVHVDKNAVFYVGENALVYSGGGIQTKDNGTYDIHGNMMVVGTGTDVIKTLNSAGTGDKLDGGNIILRLNNPAASATSTYGQLYIQGVAQGNISAVVDKEYRTPKHGTYQQIALPFNNKTISSLSGSSSTIGTLGKTFSNTRYSQNEVLTWNNTTVVSDNLAVSSVTPKSTTYYMLGSKNLDFNNPPASMPANAPAANGTVYTLKGVPFTNGVSEKLLNAGAGINFGNGGNNKNSYNERYNSYHGDDWDAALIPSNPWSAVTFGKNIYQFGNPYLTNLDLTFIGKVEGGSPTDGNSIPSIQGVRYDPGTVVTVPNVGTYSVGAKIINFTSGTSSPVGDIGLIIKPMQTFVVKLRNNNPEVNFDKTLYFDNLRRFKSTARANGTGYSVTAARAADGNTDTVKQLGVIALDESGQELGRTYYAVYPTATSGQTSNTNVQSVLDNQSIIGTYEEDLVNGGFDMNTYNSYWLYINEANENDFKGKAIPLALYSAGIKSLKFEIRENADLIADNAHALSTGIGFYYKAANGEIAEIKQNEIIPVTTDQYSLYYDKPATVLGANDGAVKPSRTRVVYSSAVDGFLVKFDPNWKKADIQVYDMSGKLIISEKNVLTNTDFNINLQKSNNAYIVTAVSESGEKISSKIIR